MPDNGIALERREAPGPTSLGLRARKRQPLVTGDLPWRAPNPGFGFANRRRSAGGASRRSISSFGSRKKGKGGPARAPEFKARDREALVKCAVLEAAPPRPLAKGARETTIAAGGTLMDAQTSRYHESMRAGRRPEGFWGEAAAEIDWIVSRRPCSTERRRLWPLVHRRRLQHLLQRGRPPRGARPRRAGGDHLRLAGHQHQATITYAELQTKTATLAGMLQADFGVEQGRPRHPLHADGAGGAVCDARLRAHRRDPFGGVRRLRAEGAGDPHRRLQAQAHALGKLRHRGRARHSPTSRCSTRRSGFRSKSRRPA